MKTVKSKDGTVLAYNTYGAGPALVCITGAGTFRQFKPVVKEAKTFAKEFTVYSYDRRGRGDSGNTLPYSLDREIEDIEAIIDAAGGEAYIYGHSSGAVLALEAALRIEPKISKAIIHDASYVHDQTEKRSYAVLRSKVQSFIDAGENAGAMRAFLKGIGLPKAFVYLLQFTPDWRMMTKLAPTLEYDMTLTSDIPPLDRLSAIKVPIQVVYGGKNPVGIEDVAEQLVRTIPNAALIRLDKQTHIVKPNVILPLLTKFFKP